MQSKSKTVVTVALLIAGLINLFPLIGVLSAEQLESMYGIPMENSDLVILMRHRAILFGLLGSFIIYSAFRPVIQSLACHAALFSMLGFVILAFTAEGYGAALHKIVIADLIGLLAIVVALVLRQFGGAARQQ